VVITGVSGSGKSTLAFDTLYAEGQRRYVESLSSYARQFLGIMDKPDVDSIDGLSPAISIEQKSISKNPRSTVGTTTEVYDYLRLLFARIGTPHCYKCGKPISTQTLDRILDRTMSFNNGSKIIILAPLVSGQKGSHEKLFKRLQKDGFARVRCNDCGYEFLLQFSCKTRCICPSCQAKRAIILGHHLNENVLYPVPHRQYVFSIPIIIRKFFLYNRSLLARLATCAADSLLTFFRTSLGLDDGVCGAVMTIQTFGDYAKWHPHIHSIVADGLFRRNGVFHVMPKLTITPLAELSRSLTSFAYRSQRLVYVERGSELG
jgi:hypothetical protein